MEKELKSVITPEERLKYVDLVLRFQNIEIHKDLMKKLINTIDLVDKKKGNTNMLDMIRLDQENKKL